MFFLSSCCNKHFQVALQISVAWQARLHVTSSSRYLALITTKTCQNIFAASPIPNITKISILSTSGDSNVHRRTETWRSQRALLSHFRYERAKIVTYTHFWRYRRPLAVRTASIGVAIATGVTLARRLKSFSNRESSFHCVTLSVTDIQSYWWEWRSYKIKNTRIQSI